MKKEPAKRQSLKNSSKKSAKPWEFKYRKKILELRRVCNIAFDKDLIDTHSGNISMGIDKDLLITKTGRSLVNLKQQDFTVVPITRPKKGDKKYNDCSDNGASSEIDIHRFILKSFPNSTVLHSHPLDAVVLSLHTGYGFIKPPDIKTPRISTSSFNKIEKLYKEYPGLSEITPLDFESAYFFPKIYVFPLNLINDIKTKNLMADFEAREIFKENGVFMIKSHGSFAWGKTPLDALRWTMMLEASAKIILKYLSF
ncbi:MAG: class II aldolase/adducin family protein [Deltaproteobacteria bacterium]|nr:class II aldolase/adducin family protein [Deltaproteobacteria bacterium]